MITKGIVEEIVTKNKIRVRVPIYHKAASDPNHTPTSNIEPSLICSPAGMKSVYSKGDVVYVAYEEDSKDHPVIIGQLQTDAELNSSSDLTVDSLNIKVNYTLPSETSNTTSSIMGGDMQQSIIYLQQQIDAIKKDMTMDSVILTTKSSPPSFVDGEWVQGADSFVMKFEDTPVQVYVWKKKE